VRSLAVCVCGGGGALDVFFAVEIGGRIDMVAASRGVHGTAGGVVTSHLLRGLGLGEGMQSRSVQMFGLG